MTSKSPASGRGTEELLVEILDEVHRCRGYLKTTAESTAKTATNTKSVRQDVRAMREGNTGAGSRSGVDPLSAPKRAEVNRVKEIIREKRKENPSYSLLSVSRFVRMESRRNGRIGGYTTDVALNSRASTELKREERGLSPY